MSSVADFSKRLKELRTASGLTQKELAIATGISKASIISYENGLRTPTLNSIAALENYFKVSGEFLRGEVDRDTYLKNQENIETGVDLMASTFVVFKDVFSISDQPSQKVTTDAFTAMIKALIVDLRSGSEAPERIVLITAAVESFNSLSTTGQKEMLKRLREYALLDKLSGSNADPG